MKSGSTKPAMSNGIPKMRPMVAPWPSVRLITRPAINRTSPTAMLNEKLYALSKVRPVFATSG